LQVNFFLPISHDLHVGGQLLVIYELPFVKLAHLNLHRDANKVIGKVLE